MIANDIIKNCDIIMVGQQPWDIEIGSNNKNIALEFSKNNRVLYVNSPLDRSTALQHRSDPKIKKRIGVINSNDESLSEVHPNLWVYYPDELIESINWLPNSTTYFRLNKINNQRFAKSIKKAIKRLNFKSFVLFNDNDIFRCYYLKELLKPKFSIYYSRDFLLSVDYWKLHGKTMEPKLIAKSDICVANSVYLADYCRKYNPNSYYVGQGCDIDEFTHYEGGIPAEMSEFKRPVIGYVGALQHIRLDIELIKNVALNMPGCSFVLVGPEDDEFAKSDLHSIENVHFLGAKPTDQMPAYIKSFDVCFNPQIVNEVTIGNYPRKIDEYLAMGKPVIATKTQGMSVFKNHTYLCDNYEEYIASIKKALQNNSPKIQQERIAFASTHTWENSVKKIYEAINYTDESRLHIKGKAIIIFGNMRYSSPIEATSLFLARALAKDNVVYYIEYPSTIRDYARDKNTKEFIAIKDSFFNANDALIDTGIPNLKKLILPIVGSINFLPEGRLFRMLLKINERLIYKRIKSVLKKNNIKDYIFINSFNFHYPDIGRMLRPMLNIYQCIDPIITPYDLKHGFVSEAQLVKDSDVIICTSKALYTEKSKTNKKTYLVPNAADLSHSSKALNPALAIHPKLDNVPKIIIGYFGSIERRMDYDLLHEVITAHPDKSFVFAGPVVGDHVPAWFNNTPNVFLTGQIPYDEMPQMVKGFDIAIIPFKKDDVSATIFPLKLFEYLGAGKPVIVTDFNPDLKDHTRNTVKFCADADSFNQAINDILEHDDELALVERMEVANENTWEASAKLLVEIMEKELKAKALLHKS